VNGQKALNLENRFPTKAQYNLKIITKKKIYPVVKWIKRTMPNQYESLASALDKIAGGLAIISPVIAKIVTEKAFIQ